MQSRPRLSRALLAAALLAAVLAPAAHAVVRSQANGGLRFDPPHQLPFLVGLAKENTGAPPGTDLSMVHLGGFGLGPTRSTSGPFHDIHGNPTDIYARALAISTRGADGRRDQTLLFADLENQGTFAAYKQGPYGIWDVRPDVSQATGV